MRDEEGVNAMAQERQFKIVRDFTARLMKLVRGTGSPAAPTLPRFYGADQFRAAIEREQARAERNGHQVTLAVIPVNGHSDGRTSLPPPRDGRSHGQNPRHG
jgi:hypothetical protein